MLRIQEELFAKSRARMDAGGSGEASGEGEGAAAVEADEPKAETE